MASTLLLRFFRRCSRDLIPPAVESVLETCFPGMQCRFVHPGVLQRDGTDVRDPALGNHWDAIGYWTSLRLDQSHFGDNDSEFYLSGLSE